MPHQNGVHQGVFWHIAPWFFCCRTRYEMYIPLTRIQKLIGERMAKSKQSKPCFYIESKADVTELMALRPKLSKSWVPKSPAMLLLFVRWPWVQKNILLW